MACANCDGTGYSNLRKYDYGSCKSYTGMVSKTCNDGDTVCATHDSSTWTRQCGYPVGCNKGQRAFQCPSDAVTCAYPGTNWPAGCQPQAPVQQGPGKAGIF